MGTRRLVEFEDLAWFPASVRDAGTDLLRFMWEAGNTFGPIVPRLHDALIKSGSDEILDLASGGGGPIMPLHHGLAKAGWRGQITLSDKHPNLEAFRRMRELTNGRVGFLDQPVDAINVPEYLPGFRTMFGTLHHFTPEQLSRILIDAIRLGRGIGLFDLRARTPPPLSMLLLGNPLGVLLATPFVRPVRASRLLWTYVIPIVPLFVTWDALVSGLRLYTVEELQAIVNDLPPNDYMWEIGSEARSRALIYLIGYPKP